MVANLSQCPAGGDLERLLAEQLSGPERDSVETHVEGCTSCQEQLARLASGTFRPLPSSSAVRGESDPGPDEGFLRRLREMPPPTLVPGRDAYLFPADERPASPPRPAGGPAGLEHRRLGQYEILEKLGAGGMGAVYLARHVELGKVVALKVLPADQMDEVSVARFKNEVRAIGRLDHPHIVAAHDAGESGGVPYLVMDFVVGVDLDRVLQERGSLRIADACEASRQAAVALQHAYEHGLVHRDIKPSNLMLARGGIIKLLDLGLARSFGDTPAETLTAKGMLLGTADYLAPEQWEHPSAADIRADIYGLGCTLYHLLAGLPPFAPPRYGTVMTKMRGHLEEQPAPIGDSRPEVPAGLAAVLGRMMAKAPADRYATPATVAEALAPFAAGADLAGLLGPSPLPLSPGGRGEGVRGAGMASRLSAADTPRPVQALAETRPQRGAPARLSPARRRRYVLPLALAGVSLLLAAAAVSYWSGLWRSPPPAPRPLEIEQLRVNHYRGRPEKLVGDIASTTEEVQVRDAVRVYAKFNEPAYCYLIAFNPDGTEQLCHPAWEENNPAQARAVRPEKVAEVRFFPKETEYFGLDSTGLQVFVLVASTKPLPPYAEWRTGAGTVPWRVVRHSDRRWQFDGRAITPLPVERGFRQEGEAEPKALRELCDFFKNRPDVEAVQVIAFPVAEADRARQLNAKSLELCREGKYTEAQEPIRELIDLLTGEKGKDHFETLDARRELQALKQVAALPEAARAEYTEALRLLDQVGMLKRQARYPEALPMAERALEVLQRHLGPEHLVVAVPAYQYGQLLHQSGWYAKAEPLFRRALKIVQQEMGEDHPGVAKVSGDLAMNLDAQRKHAKARPLHDAALKLTIRLQGEEHPDTAVAYNNLAGHFGRQALHAEAEPLYQKSLAILLRSEGEDGPRVAVVRDNLAFHLNAQGKYLAAEAMYRQVLVARLKSLGEDHPDTAMTFNGLANNLDAQGKHADAQPLIRKMLDIYRRRFGEENPHTAVALNNLAMNLQHQGKFDEADPFFETALAIQRRAAPGGKSEPVAVVHNNRAANLQAQGKVAEAQKELEQALEIFRAILGEDHPDVALALNNLAAVLDAQKKYAEAEPLLDKSLEILQERLGPEHPQTVQASVNRAINLHNQGKYREAKPQLEEALEAYRRVLGEGHPSTAWAYLKLIINSWALGEYQKAEELGAPAATSFEAARPRLSFAGLDRVSRADELSPYRFLAAVAARNGNFTAAWRYLEYSLARGLLDDLTAPRVSDEERSREQQLLRDLKRLDGQLAALLGGKAVTVEARKEADNVRRERDRVQAKLVEFQAERAAQNGAAAGKVYDHLPALQKKLRPDAALVAWVDITGGAGVKDPNGEHWACVVRHEGAPVWVRLPGSGPDRAWVDADDELPASVRRHLASRTDVSKGQWKDLVSKLHAQRLAPVEKYLGARDPLPAVRHLIVLPSPQMAGIPIEALLSPQAPRDQFTVSYAPSGTMFAWLQEQGDQAKRQGAPARPRLLALGDPTFQRAELGEKSGPATARERVPFADLPATRKELRAISRVFDRPELLMGSEASEQNLDRMAAEGKLREFRFLHFATHGVLDDDRALRSALILAQDQLPEPLGQVLGGQPAYDGRLTAEQILRSWKLDADLVTLSACDTGLGKYSRSEGFLGFSQALFLAGARGMVLSLWPVDDRATALLMARFYENMLDEKAVTLMPKAEALAEAKRWLRGLSAEEVERLTADLPRGLPDGTRGVRRSGPPAAADATRPFEHPYYWSAFILIGDPR